ncbi:carbohydrate ABC transporter permease [Pseudarthrobacter sp. R1]|uniref:carbohydrate ABC transporter permease n=1 Tax=Pseudarthrobacter sp. R1 TaxID=2944934 RepID=UPI002109A43D|nr:carbohydrate ABC transporter permease [Pseudarthrobacter sp. R1]MCQ6272750.1 carbohydrate ABC transporter permease [Pseudarthrobacter sp. R1]
MASPDRGKWWRFLVISVATAIVLIPVALVVFLSVRAAPGSPASITFENFRSVFQETDVLTWLSNSLVVTLCTVTVCIVVAAPAGYALSRGRGRAVSAYSLTLFVLQSLPVITAIVPLFILFAGLRLVDNLVGVTIVYVGVSLAVAIWMLAAYFDSIPIALEEAAWVDGASMFGSFTRIVLRNSMPGILSTAIFSFVVAWNDYLVAVIFLRSFGNYTLPVGLQTFFQQNSTEWGLVMAVAVVMMAPPVLLFVFLNRYFSVGGIGGSLAGR